MADNAHPSDDPLVAGEVIAGVIYQRVKLTDPSDDSTDSHGVAANPVRTDPTGDTAQPVTDNGGSLTVDGTVTANAGTGPWPVTDNGGALTVDDGGSSLTVDGTVTAHAGTGPWPVTDNGGSLTIDGTIAATQSGSWNVGVTGTVAVTDNSGSLTVDNGGTFAVQADTELATKDYDSGAGTDTQAVVGILLPKSGGAVAGGTSSDPLRTDPTGTTAQPVTDNGGSLTVDGTVTANAGTGPWPVTDNGGSLTVDGTVAATQSGTWNVGTVTSVTNVVHVDDNSSTLSVDDGGGSLTVDAASLPLPTGASTAAKQPALGTAGSPATDVISVQGVASGTVLPVSDGGGTLSIDDGGGSITVDGSLTLSPGTGATDLGKAEDAAHSSGDVGVMMLGVRRSDANSLTSLAGSNDDYQPFTTDTRGVLQVLARPTVSRIRVASSGLTTAATTYAVGDTAGTLMTFSNAAKVSGGTGTILSAVLLDKGDVGTDYRLHIYRASVTLASDNAAWSVSDSDQESLIGIIVMPSMIDVGANRVSTLANIGLPYDCSGTDLFVGIETRTANSVYAAATDLNLILTVLLD